MASRVAALILLGVICLGLVSAEVPMDCCLKVSTRHLPASRILRYKIQEAGMGCDIDATVFITKTGRQLCMGPAKDLPWVQQVIGILNERAKTQ